MTAISNFTMAHGSIRWPGKGPSLAQVAAQAFKTEEDADAFVREFAALGAMRVEA